MTLTQRLAIAAGAALTTTAMLSPQANALVFDPCVDLDLSQVEDCRSGVCYGYRPGPRKQVTCKGKTRWTKTWIPYRIS